MLATSKTSLIILNHFTPSRSHFFCQSDCFSCTFITDRNGLYTSSSICCGQMRSWVAEGLERNDVFPPFACDTIVMSVQNNRYVKKTLIGIDGNN